MPLWAVPLDVIALQLRELPIYLENWPIEMRSGVEDGGAEASHQGGRSHAIGLSSLHHPSLSRSMQLLIMPKLNQEAFYAAGEINDATPDDARSRALAGSTS